MSSYCEALPNHKAAMDGAVRVDAVAQRLAPDHTHTLGGRLRETTLDVFMLVGATGALRERESCRCRAIASKS
jgi:hypothetical protein